ncbi:VanZ family protein [Evansella sp. AB-rgal1]|uniref:VanZ family protein n=1 Tax=Evansella sp. AB-rgal1 TaxID=3242696 RepID=UPI00359D16BE
MKVNAKIWLIMAVVWCIIIAIVTRNPFFTGDSTEQLLTNPFFDSVILNIVLRKTGHVTAFGILAILFWLGLRGKKYRYFLAWLFATIYGAIDEYHQSFVPGRDGVFTDVLYNSAGALLAIVCIFIIIKKYGKSELKNTSEG